jgi:hypothetical protein
MYHLHTLYKREVTACFVGTVGVFDHHCLNFLFIFFFIKKCFSESQLNSSFNFELNIFLLINYIPDSNHTMKYLNLHKDVKTKQKGGKIKQRNMILICISERMLFIKENKKEMRPA